MNNYEKPRAVWVSFAADAWLTEDDPNVSPGGSGDAPPVSDDDSGWGDDGP